MCNKRSICKVFNYKNCIKYKEGDARTVVNIELLLKENENNGGKQGQPKQNPKQRMLTQAGVGRFKGN